MSVGYFFPHTWIVWLSWLCPARGLASFSIKLHIFHSERIPFYGHQIGALHLKLKRFIKYCKLRSVIKRLFRIFSVIIFKPDVEEAGLVVERQPCAHQCGRSLWALYKQCCWDAEVFWLLLPSVIAGFQHNLMGIDLCGLENSLPCSQGAKVHLVVLWIVLIDKEELFYFFHLERENECCAVHRELARV